MALAAGESRLHSHGGMENGQSWEGDGAYLSLTTSPNTTAETHDRRRPGINHLAFKAGSPAEGRFDHGRRGITRLVTALSRSLPSRWRTGPLRRMVSKHLRLQNRSRCRLLASHLSTIRRRLLGQSTAFWTRRTPQSDPTIALTRVHARGSRRPTSSALRCRRRRD